LAELLVLLKGEAWLVTVTGPGGTDKTRLAGETRALVGVCQVLVAQDGVERTEQLSQELLELARQDDDVRAEHFALHYLADCSLIRGDYDRATERYRESLRSVLRLGDLMEASFEVQGVAMAASGRGDPCERSGWAPRPRPAGTLAASASRFRSGTRCSRSTSRRPQTARRRRGRHWSDGRNLSFDDAISVALE
jgi:hypothetical protein